ncbi:hypothetical protein PLESTM_001193500 [Pleodorina starrii]|nr:hypothetical protein PLESTM_001193500 [Pleodorina starrii]
MPNSYLEGHLLPAGLDLATLQRLFLVNSNSSTTAATNTTSTPLESYPQLQGLFGGRGSSTPSAEARSATQVSGRGGGGFADEAGAPDLGSLTLKQLVRLCQPDDVTSDLEGLKLLSQGRLSVTCQALWRGARVAVKFSSSPTLHPSSSAIISQALVSKTLAHPNVLQHYSVRCCRIALVVAAATASPLSRSPPLAATAVDSVAQPADGGGGGIQPSASAPMSFGKNAQLGEGYDTVAAAATIGGGLAALNHLSTPAATTASANALATTDSVGSNCGASARDRLAAAGQVEDLVVADPTAASVAAGHQATAGLRPPIIRLAATSGNRVLKASSQQRPGAPQGAGNAADGAANTLAEIVTAAPPPLPPPHLHAGAAAAAGAAAVGTIAAAAAGTAAAASTGDSRSFNSYEGFGNPFASARHALSLAHVAALLSATEGEYLTAIIMEHADKSTLHAAVLQGMFLPSHVWSARVALRALLRTSLELAFALRHLHGCGVVHGSLRPANVLLKSARLDRRGFTTKVSNFSLARVCLGDYDDLVLAPAPPPGLPREHLGSGAAAAAAAVGRSESGRRRCNGGGGAAREVDAAELPFWSPEQLCGVVGKPSDVYAFGVTLYFMCTSSLPYTGIPAHEVVHGVAAGMLQPQWPDTAAAASAAAAAGGSGAAAARTGARSLLPPAPIRALCAQCWQADPRARPTFSQICASLQTIEHAVREQLRVQTCEAGSIATEFSGPQPKAQAAAQAQPQPRLLALA